jgi:hypothetical protein
MLAVNTERVPWVTEGAVPYYKELRNFEWCDQLLKKWAAQDEVKRLEAIRADIRATAPTAEEYLETLRRSYEGYQSRRIEQLSRYLSENIKNRDPLGRYERLAHFLLSTVSWDEIEQAAGMLPPEAFGKAKSASVEKELKKVSAEIERQKSIVAECCPPPFLKLHAGILSDTREILVDFWRRLQNRCADPIGCTGFAIRTYDGPEQAAYEVLGIRQHVNPKGLACAER